MLAEWGNRLIIALSLLTFLAYLIEFWGGPKQKALTKAVLEDWWLRLDQVTAPSFGYKEATFTFTVLQNVFGKSAFSGRRLKTIGTWAAIAALLYGANTAWNLNKEGYVPAFGAFWTFVVTNLFFRSQFFPPYFWAPGPQYH